MTGIAILCSGQGAQSAGMFDLLADAPEAAPVFAAAKAALGGRDARDLVRSASSAEIHTNKVGQILCCTLTMAAWAVIGEGLPRPLVVAGYSVGELGAWGVAGLLDAAGVLDLAVKRAMAMDAATIEPSGLVAIRGLRRDVLDPLCAALDAHVAIINAPDQMIVGGTQASLAAVVQAAQAAGAERTTMLAVAVASHTPLLRAASDRFRQDLAATTWPSQMPPDIRLLSGIDGGAVFDVPAGLDKLARQIKQTVDWQACMEACRAADVTKIIELGPGNALARMMDGILPGADAHSLSEFHSLAGFRRWAER
ncbi:ACP S-malonyltransferase [Acidisoma cladoniae]|jgi:[acyl-carrier-protein] S-malonyltransferase|uniref:ACP S-malonyltransferase n=1 Tax=Acidisoma cladoniae TaxID=3040935 RepID=UPI00254B951F|nr:acyltransferase domain-containing protein [Acidisoma sp. PAMC 29798]